MGLRWGSAGKIFFRSVFSALIIALAVAATVHLDFSEPYLGYGLAGGFLFLLAIRPRTIELMQIALTSAVLAIFYWKLHEIPARLYSECILGMLGLATLVVVGIRAIWANSDERQRYLYVLLPALVLGFLLVGSQYSLNLAAMLYPKTLDLYAYAFDGSMHWEPSFTLARQVAGHSVAYSAMAVAYESIPLAIAVLYAAHLHRILGYHWEVVEAVFAAALIGYVFFAIFPVCGPAHAFPHDFPGNSLSYPTLKSWPLQWIPVTRAAPRNGVPSLHMSWALLIWWNLKGFQRWAVIVAGIYALITAFCTLASGEHYLFDLVVALPFSLAIQGMVISLRRRRRLRHSSILLGSGIFLLWLMIGRYGAKLMLLTPILPWTLALLSTWVCLARAWRLPALVVGLRYEQGVTGAAQ